MTQRNKLCSFLLLVCLCLPFLLAAQGNEIHDHGGTSEGLDSVFWFGVLELPFLFLCVYYSFRTAGALKGGIFGQGMNYLAWGFLVMAVGHIAMQIQHIFHYDVFRDTLGHFLGNTAWFIALIITWGLSAIGFYRIYKVSKSG
ncbi:MAG: hypothetical protein HRU41_19705 [Saprospiraceae bacterium]|nr:hypothetical protein [Saprospiraceae bacterium]